MECFVEDLLNLKLIKEGVFKLVKEPFEIEDALNFVISMFEAHFKTKGLVLELRAFKSIEMPPFSSYHKNKNTV